MWNHLAKHTDGRALGGVEGRGEVGDVMDRLCVGLVWFSLWRQILVTYYVSQDGLELTIFLPQ